MKLTLLALTLSVMGFGQTPPKVTPGNGTTTIMCKPENGCYPAGQTSQVPSKSPDPDEMFRISLSVAQRACTEHPKASAFIFSNNWVIVSCSRILHVMRTEPAALRVPDWIDEMHAETKHRDAVIAEVIKEIKHNQEILKAK